MIIGFIGKMGSGKTLSLVREIYKYFLKGYTVYSNFGLSFEHTPIDFSTLYKWVEEQKQLDNVVIALDEVHIMLDSRSGMSKKSKTMTFWLNQTRKMGVKLFYTTQYMHQVDKRLRSGTDVFVFCEGVLINKNSKEYFICCNEITDGDASKKDLFVGNDFYKFYDTNEVIKFLGNEDANDKEGIELSGS